MLWCRWSRGCHDDVAPDSWHGHRWKLRDVGLEFLGVDHARSRLIGVGVDQDVGEGVGVGWGDVARRIDGRVCGLAWHVAIVVGVRVLE